MLVAPPLLVVVGVSAPRVVRHSAEHLARAHAGRSKAAAIKREAKLESERDVARRVFFAHHYSIAERSKIGRRTGREVRWAKETAEPEIYRLCRSSPSC